MAGAADHPARDAVFTTWPSPCAISEGTKLRMPLITPQTFTSNTHRQSSKGVSQLRPK